MTLPFHRFADLFPMMQGDAFTAFCADVAAHGLHEKIVLHEGAILDGRNRYRAAIKAGYIRPDQKTSSYFRKFDPKAEGDPLEWVVSLNVHRRHLDESQRAMVAEAIADMPQGARTDIKKLSANVQKVAAPDKGAADKVSRARAAEMLAVSTRSLDHARVVRKEGTPELVKAVENRTLAVSLAAKAAKLSPAVQKKIVDEAKAGKANAVRTVVKREARAAKEKTLAKKQRALPDRKYGVIYADPEWRFEPRSRETGMDRAADNHYSTSDTATIAARGVAKIAADDCVLFLWATAPMLPDALRVMEAWGFAYKSHIVWRKAESHAAKVVLGTGYWFRCGHEILLVGTRGNMPAPAMGSQAASILDAPPLRHSQKPEAFAALIEAYFPNLPKIELNARKARKGWDAWGNEAPEGEKA